jgi:hypothetical protein
VNLAVRYLAGDALDREFFVAGIHVDGHDSAGAQ